MAHDEQLDVSHVGLSTFIMASWRGILSIFMIAATGALLSRSQIITKDTQKSITSILSTVCIPALSFLAISRRISFEVLQRVWIVPVMAFVHIGTGCLIAYIICRVMKLDPSFRALLMCTTSFPNSISMPLAMLNTLSAAIGDRASWLDVERGEGVILTYAAAMILGRWTVGFWVLKPKDDWNLANVDDAVSLLESEREQEEEEGTIGMVTFSTTTITGSDSEKERDEKEEEEREEEREEEEVKLGGEEEERGMRVDEEERGSDLDFLQPRPKGTLQKIKEKVLKIPPPVAAIFVGAFVGLGPLRFVFYPAEDEVDSDGIIENDPPPGVVLFIQYFGTLFIDTLTSVSSITVPLSLMLLGSSLLKGIKATSVLGSKVIFLACFLKLLLMPLCASAIIVLLYLMGAISPNAQIVDLLCLLIPTAMPPATNLIILTNLHNTLNAECAAVIFFNFISSLATMPINAIMFGSVIRFLIP